MHLASYVLQDLFTSHCGTKQQGVPRKHMVAIVRAHCLPELSEEVPAHSVPLVRLMAHLGEY